MVRGESSLVGVIHHLIPCKLSQNAQEGCNQLEQYLTAILGQLRLLQQNQSLDRKMLLHLLLQTNQLQGKQQHHGKLSRLCPIV